MWDLSIAEQKLVGFARQRFGEFITTFLLAGLGEEEMVQSRLFAITLLGNEGVGERRLVQVIADERQDIQTYCPRLREPLVLLALLQRLMSSSGGASATLFYTYEDIMKLLAWEHTLESESAIDLALEQYFGLNFQPIMGEREMKERGLLFLKSKERIIGGYGFNDVTVEGSWNEPVIRRVDFSMNFVKNLKERSLFWIDWNRVTSLELISHL